MDDQLTVALISGGTALIVALLGIAGAIAAQLVSTRRAFENSLTLFERQRAEEERIRRQTLRREDAYRFTEQRRVVYGKLLRTINDLVVTSDVERTAEKYWERLDRQLARTRSPSDDLRDAVAASRQNADDATERRKKLSTEVSDLLEEVQLIADAAVRTAAEALNTQARRATDISEQAYSEARTEFLQAARQELGIEAPLPLPTPQSPDH